MIPLLGPLAGLIAGILVSPFLDPQAVAVCLPAAAGIALLRRWFLIPVFFLLGAVRSAPEVPVIPLDHAVNLIGTLTAAPEWRGVGVYLDLNVRRCDGQPYLGKARLNEFLEDANLRALFEALQLGSGDELEILVKLRRPTVYRDPGVFDFRQYLERQGIYWTGTVRSPRLIRVIQRGNHGKDRIGGWIRMKLKRSFPDEEARGLVAAMVLGQKSGLSARSERLFQQSGLYHLVVVSGFNLAVIGGLAFLICRRLPLSRTTRLWLVLSSGLGYAKLVEGQAPVFRAALMLVFFMFGKLLDRGPSTANAIAGSALIQLLITPQALQDPSFQMTYAAVASVAGIGGPLSHWVFSRLTECLFRFEDSDRDAGLPIEAADWRVARRMWCELHGLPYCVATLPWKALLFGGQMLLVSLCVECVFAYFMAESFHRLSPWSPLVNVPAGLIASVVTPLGLAAVALPGPLSGAVAKAATSLLRLLLWSLEALSAFPLSSIRVPSPPPWIWILYAAAVFCLVCGIKFRRRTLVLGGFASILSLQALIAFKDFSDKPPEQTTLTFLDVGQGDSTLIEFPNGSRVLVDGGGVAAGRFLDLQDETTFSIGESVVSPFLFAKGLRRLDAVVLTHAHNDHLDGLLSVIDNFEVGSIWLGRNPMVPAYRRLIEKAQAKSIPLRFLVSGDRILMARSSIDRVQDVFTVLHPPGTWKVKRTAENDDSLVLLLNTGAVTALLTGDIERPISAPDHVNVMKVSHHGSKGVRLRVRANIRVISVGANNPFGHPHPSLMPALRTDELGAIRVTLGNPPGAASLLTHPGHWYKLAIPWAWATNSRP